MLSDEQLSAFINYVEVVSCPRSATLFKEGDAGDFMFFILEGQMRVFIRQKSGDVMGLRLLDSGDALGEVALLTQANRSASVEAVNDCTLIKVNAASLAKMMTEQPAIAAQFLYHQARMTSRQLADLTNQLRARREQADMLTFLQ